MSNSPTQIYALEHAPKSVASLTGGMVEAIVPKTFDDVYRFAQIISKSGLAPYGMSRPEQLTVAILMGLEIGVKPMQAIQGIAVINGRPSIWGDLALAIVYNSMLVENFVETYEGQPPVNWEKPVGAELEYKAVCRVKRRGQAAEIVGEYSIGDAMTAKLWMKKGGQDGKKDTPWVTSPKRMLKMRARGYALRDGFADCLKGMPMAEEMQGVEADPVHLQLEPPVPPATQIAPPAADAPPIPPDEAVIIEDTAERGEALIREIEEQLATTQSSDDVQEVWTMFQEDIDRVLTRTQRETICARMEELQDTKPTRAEHEHERREKIAGAGGAGIAGYMEEDEKDAELAEQVSEEIPFPGDERVQADARPAADPFEIPPRFQFADSYEIWLRNAVAATETLDQAKRLAEIWKQTKVQRDPEQLPQATAEALHTELLGRINEIKAKAKK